MHEVENFVRMRQLRDEPRETYLIRVAKAATRSEAEAADRLSPRAYAWVMDAAARLADGQYPLEFDDDRIQVSVSDQLLDLLEVEDELERSKSPRKRSAATPREGRRGDYDRIAQYILQWPDASNRAVASELSSTGWSVDHKRVGAVRAELRRALSAMKSSGIVVRRPSGARIISL